MRGASQKVMTNPVFYPLIISKIAAAMLREAENLTRCNSNNEVALFKFLINF